MQAAKEQIFTPAPRAWLEDRLAKLDRLHGKRTEQSALVLRGLTSAVMLTPKSPTAAGPTSRPLSIR